MEKEKVARLAGQKKPKICGRCGKEVDELANFEVNGEILEPICLNCFREITGIVDRQIETEKLEARMAKKERVAQLECALTEACQYIVEEHDRCPLHIVEINEEPLLGLESWHIADICNCQDCPASTSVTKEDKVACWRKLFLHICEKEAR